jgi:hypothetical protein
MLHIYDTVPGVCETFDSSNRWTYNPMPLWTAYALLLLVGMAGLVLGAVSIYSNGCTSEMSFSHIMCTTRNPVIDRLVAFASARFGSSPLPKELEEVQMQFGELIDNGHVAFGVEGQVTPLIIGKCEQRLA